MFPLVLRLLIEILPLQFFAEASFQLSMWLPSVVGAKQSMYVSLITAPTLCNSEHAPPQYHVVRRLNDDSILLSYLCQQADIGTSAVKTFTLQYSTVQCSTEQYCTLQYSTVQYMRDIRQDEREDGQYSTAQCTTIQYSTVQYMQDLRQGEREDGQYSTILLNTVQYSTVQYCAILYTTVQYSTVEYMRDLRQGEREDVQYSWQFILQS